MPSARSIEQRLVACQLKGVVDKIEWLESGQLKVVDYKTGRPDPSKLNPPGEKRPEGGPFWRQLVFYKILIEHSGLFEESVQTAALEWLEPDKQGGFRTDELEFTAHDIDFVKNLIKTVYQTIKNKEFHTGCGKEDCEWCELIKNRTLPMRFSPPETELDD